MTPPKLFASLLLLPLIIPASGRPVAAAGAPPPPGPGGGGESRQAGLALSGLLREEDFDVGLVASERHLHALRLMIQICHFFLNCHGKKKKTPNIVSWHVRKVRWQPWRQLPDPASPSKACRGCPAPSPQRWTATAPPPGKEVRRRSGGGPGSSSPWSAARREESSRGSWPAWKAR